MNQNNNKDLYQIIGINKNTSLREINSLVLKTSPKDNPEVGKALMVLTDPQKKIEYDKCGWKDSWEIEWQSESDFRNSIFEAIQNYKHHYGNTKEYTPDGHQVAVFAEIHLDPKLWAPFQDQNLGWVKKIWGTYGENWKQELEDFKNKMLIALDEAWEKNKKTPMLDIWKAAEGGNCGKCGKPARLRWKEHKNNDKVYCSHDCALEDMKIDYELPEKESLKPKKCVCVECNYEGYYGYKRDDGSFRCKACFNKELEKLRNSFKDDGNKEYESDEKCDYCGKKIKYRQEGNSHSFKGGIGSVDHEGNRYTFCSDECCQKGAGSKAKGIVRKHAFTKLLQWMEKEGITNIYLDPDSKKLTINYGKNNSKTIEDNNLTPEQKEIKKYFQQVGKNSLSQQEVREEIKGKNKGGDSGLGSVIVVGIVVCIFALIGVIIYKHKKKGY